MKIHEYSEGIAYPGIVILKDGEPMDPKEIITELKKANEFMVHYYELTKTIKVNNEIRGGIIE